MMLSGGVVVPLRLVSCGRGLRCLIIILQLTSGLHSSLFLPLFASFCVNCRLSDSQNQKNGDCVHSVCSCRVIDHA